MILCLPGETYPLADPSSHVPPCENFGMVVQKPGLLAARDLRSRKRSASVISSAVQDDSQVHIRYIYYICVYCNKICRM